MKELKVAAKVEELDNVLLFADTALEEVGCPLKVQMQIDLSIEEIFVNIASYAYPSGGGEARICFSSSEEPRQVTFTFYDTGIPFNPLAKEDPDVTLPAEKRRIGGLGIFLVKKKMDEVTYEYKDGQNVLSFIKNF